MSAVAIQADKTRPTNPPPPPKNPPPAGPKTEPPPAGPKRSEGRAIDDPAQLADAARIFRVALARRRGGEGGNHRGVTR